MAATTSGSHVLSRCRAGRGGLVAPLGYCGESASAICERLAFWTQTKRTQLKRGVHQFTLGLRRSRSRTSRHPLRPAC